MFNLLLGWTIVYGEMFQAAQLKPIHWVKSSAQWSLFQRMTADMSALARLERFGENDPVFKKWRLCRTVYSMNGFLNYIFKEGLGNWLK